MKAEQGLVFLDFDGVIHLYNEPHGTKGMGFRASAVEALNWLLAESGAVIVVSSSWRLHYSRTELCDLLLSAGVVGSVIGMTPVLARKQGLIYVGYTRGNEISEYLDREAHTGPYVVLDDDPNIAPHEARWVQCLWDDGLTMDGARRALEILDGR